MTGGIAGVGARRHTTNARTDTDGGLGVMGAATATKR